MIHLGGHLDLPVNRNESGDKDTPKPADGETETEAEAKPAATAGSDVKVDDDDVKLVVAQTGCTEEKAREALKAENGDLINASKSPLLLGFRKELIGPVMRVG